MVRRILCLRWSTNRVWSSKQISLSRARRWGAAHEMGIVATMTFNPYTEYVQKLDSYRWNTVSTKLLLADINLHMHKNDPSWGRKFAVSACRPAAGSGWVLCNIAVHVWPRSVQGKLQIWFNACINFSNSELDINYFHLHDFDSF